VTTRRPRPAAQVIPLFGDVRPSRPVDGRSGLVDGQRVRVRQPDGTWRHGVVDLAAYGLGVGPVGEAPTRQYVPVVFEELVDVGDVEPA